MTRRDYNMIAACIKSHAERELACNNSEVGVQVMWDFAKHIASELLNTNPRFDMNMFLDACKVDTKETT